VEKTWKEREPAIKELVPALVNDLFFRTRRKPVDIRVYFCEGVMALVRYIREETKGMEKGVQHHVFKILSKHVEYGDRGLLEVSSKGKRMDIYFEDTMASIEVKTLTMATWENIHDTTMAAFESGPADKVWIFFLYKFKDNASPRPPCQYLLVWIAVDTLDVDFDRVGRQVMVMMQKTKQQVAKKLGVSGKILVPVENIIKVEDMEREIAEKDQALAEKDQALAKHEEVIAEKGDLLDREREKNKKLAKENAELKKRLGLK